MTFQIWNTDSANMTGAFTQECDALRAIRDAIDAHGRDHVATWALEREDQHGQNAVIAEGAVLAKHAGQHTTA